MTIDKAIKDFKDDAENNRVDLDLEFAKKNDQIAEWLEELKAYREQHQALCNSYNVHTVEDLYDKAIDDVTNMLNDIEFGGGTKETLACANATLNYIKKEIEQLRSDG